MAIDPAHPEKSVNIPLYAQGTFDRELNYKIWSTSKARFNACERLKRKDALSSRAISLLSAYLIVFSLVTTMLPNGVSPSNTQILLFLNVAFSIVILSISQQESSRNYAVRAERYHQSGLDISSLYNELRSLKTRYKDTKDDVFEKKVEELSGRYNDILQRSENHETIDFLLFKATKPDYEDHRLTSWQVRGIKAQLFVQEYIFYWACIMLPPIFFSAYVVYAMRTQGKP